MSYETISETILLPQKSDWECELFGRSIVVIPNEGDVPNWFHRLMQRLILGFKWSKNK